MQPIGGHDRSAGAGRAALAAILLSLTMCWPLLVTGQVFVFFDTDGYLLTGQRIFALVAEMADGADPSVGGDGPAAMPGGAEHGGFLRSFGYSIFSAGMVALGGPVALALAQGWIAIFMLLALIPRQVVVPGNLWLALPMAATTLPWFTVFAMPDILTSVIVVFGAVLWRSFDGLSGFHRAVLVGLAACASLAHYGNPPLAFGLYALVLSGRLVQRRLTLAVVIAAALPVLMGPLANLAASAVVLDTPSTAPKRLPILLARSIEDGPAAWYLSEACANGEDLAICDAFDGAVPDDITEFLWSDRGIRSLSEAEIEAVRREEPRILAAAFLAYPVAQSWSLTRNAWRQFHSVGLAKIEPAPAFHTPKRAAEGSWAMRLIATFDPIVDWTTLAGALALLALALANRAWIGPVAIIFCGLALNAIIFGGLSAPDDRYQARLAWILPALALCYGIRTLEPRH